MHHSPVPPAARRARPAILLALAVLLAAGCSAAGQGAAGTPSAPTGGPASPADGSVDPARTTAPTVVPPTVVPPTVTATPEASASASSGAATLASPFYRYSLTLPPGWTPQVAAVAWDGSARIDSDGPYVDRATGPGSKLFFVYGAPTDSTLATYATQGQEDVNAWHGCPATAESETDVTIGGAAGRLHGFHCQGLYVMKAFAVRDGSGWAFNQIGPPGDEAADTAAFSAMLADVDWAK